MWNGGAERGRSQKKVRKTVMGRRVVERGTGETQLLQQKYLSSMQLPSFE